MADQVAFLMERKQEMTVARTFTATTADRDIKGPTALFFRYQLALIGRLLGGMNLILMADAAVMDRWLSGTLVYGRVISHWVLMMHFPLAERLSTFEGMAVQPAFSSWKKASL